jgi:hypothetical protein
MSAPAEITQNAGRATADSADFAIEARRVRWPWRWLSRMPGQWVASCRDEARRRDKLLVVLISNDQVALVVPRGGVAVLDLLTVGGLRAALREAVLAVEDRDTARPLTYPVSTSRRSA